ncbi:MAG: hypothetical protein IJJ63_00555 [Bacilli bacterium]|nr:hypothetical protein [Bacilli bacterium]
MDTEKREKRYIIIVLILIVGCFLYLSSKNTYTAFESEIDANASTKTAGIHLSINGVDVVENNDSTLNNQIILDNTTWVSTHTREAKLSPGSTGTISLELDPAGSEVAVLYEFRFVDKVIDEDKLLNFSNITSDDDTFIRTGVDTYSGIISLTDIANGKKIHISVGFYFDYLTDIEGITEDNQAYDDLFEIHFHGLQYQGETLTPYSGS